MDTKKNELLVYCKKCKTEKEESEFYNQFQTYKKKNGSVKTVRTVTCCRQCHIKRVLVSREKNKKYYEKYRKEYEKTHVKQRRAREKKYSEQRKNDLKKLKAGV